MADVPPNNAPHRDRDERPTLYLIDGYAQFFRAYHAIRTPMTSPVTKEPTNMTFGFLGMMLKLLRLCRSQDDSSRSYVAVCLDVSGDRGTFRSAMYPAYKATRPPPPEDLRPQVERCLATLRLMNVPIIGSEGFEADDCIATIVTALGAGLSAPSSTLLTPPTTASPNALRNAVGLRVRIISKDKDLKQLLRSVTIAGAAEPAREQDDDSDLGDAKTVELFDVHTDEVIDEQKLLQETGLKPAQIIDMLALMGDTSDNVPGVKGVGPMTACKLIAEFGSLDGVLDAAAAGKIKGKMGERLTAEASDRTTLHLARQLVTLRHDVPVEFDLSSARVQGFALETLIPVLQELGFNRYQDEVRELMGEGSPRATSPTAASTAGSTAGSSTGVQRRSATSATKRGGTEKLTGFATLFDSRTVGTSQTAESDEQAATAQDGFVPPGTRRASSGEYRCLRTPDELREFLAMARKSLESNAEGVLSVDTETTGLAPMTCKLCGVCLSFESGTGVYVPVRSPNRSEHMDEATVLELLRPMLEDHAIAKCGHNLKYDQMVLRNAGVRLGGFANGGTGGSAGGSADGGAGANAESAATRATAFDSMVASFLIDATRSSHSLDALALALLNRTNISIKELLGPRPTSSGGLQKPQRTFDTVPLDAATEYAAEDADVTLQLRATMKPDLQAMGLLDLFEKLEMPLVEVLAELEFNGIRVDRGELEHQRARLQARIDTLKQEIDSACMQTIGRTFNPDSPRQLAAALFNRPDAPSGAGVSDGPGLGLKPVKRTKTGYSTDAEVLEQLAQDGAGSTVIPGLIVEYRELSKLVSTYLVALASAINTDTGRVHSSFNQTVAVTGRLASSDPNLQNIPIRTEVGREIRRAFVADSGNVLVSADYSQIELRLLAHLSKDPALIEAFHNDEDIHTTVAAQLANIRPEEVSKPQRSAAKMVNFGIVYGITPFGLARRLGVSNTEATTIIEGYKRRFAGITTFLQECVSQAKSHGFVETMLGRRRMIPDIESANPQRRALAERTAINTVVQGSAADLIKLAMVDIHRDLMAAREQSGQEAGRDGVAQINALKQVKMLLQIHDELVFEAPEAVARAVKAFVVERMEAAGRTWKFADGRALELSVPIRVDASIATNWFEGK